MKHELGEICQAVSEMTGPLNIEDPIEKKEMDALFQASDGVKHAQARLAMVADRLLTAIVVEEVDKASPNHGNSLITQPAAMKLSYRFCLMAKTFNGVIPITESAAVTVL